MNDPGGTDALLGALATGNMASKAVAANWKTSLERVIVILASGDVGARIGAARTLGHMLDPSVATLDPPARARVKAALLGASKDNFFAVRDSAISGLANIPDADVTATLTAIAATDPYRRADGAYPVRDAARRALASR